MKNEYFPPSWVDQKLIHKSANTAQLVEAASRTNINTTIRYLIASFPFQPDKCFGFFVESVLVILILDTCLKGLYGV